MRCGILILESAWGGHEWPSRPVGGAKVGSILRVDSAAERGLRHLSAEKASSRHTAAHETLSGAEVKGIHLFRELCS